MTYPAGPGSQGVPARYQGNGQWVPDPSYQGGGWWSYPARGTHLSPQELELLWIEAGGRRELAPVMAQVAERESGGWSAAWNSTGATGPWQIEWPGSAPGGWSRERLFIPAESAKAAVALSGNSLSGIEANWPGDVQSDGIPGGVGGLRRGFGLAGAGLTGALSTQGQESCLIHFPSFQSGHLLGIPLGPNIGGGCILAKSQARAIMGGTLMAAGFLIVAAGVAVLLGATVQRSPAARTAGQAASAVPGAGPAATAARAATANVAA